MNSNQHEGNISASHRDATAPRTNVSLRESLAVHLGSSASDLLSFSVMNENNRIHRSQRRPRNTTLKPSPESSRKQVDICQEILCLPKEGTFKPKGDGLEDSYMSLGSVSLDSFSTLKKNELPPPEPQLTKPTKPLLRTRNIPPRSSSSSSTDTIQKAPVISPARRSRQLPPRSCSYSARSLNSCSSSSSSSSSSNLRKTVRGGRRPSNAKPTPEEFVSPRRTSSNSLRLHMSPASPSNRAEEMYMQQYGVLQQQRRLTPSHPSVVPLSPVAKPHREKYPRPLVALGMGDASVPMCGRLESLAAYRSNAVRECHCTSCQSFQYVVGEATLLLCPDCQSIGPALIEQKTSTAEPLLGMGLTIAVLTQELSLSN